MSEGNGKAPPPVPLRESIVVAYVTLQVAGSLLLAAVYLLGKLVAPLVEGAVEVFTASWTAVFVLVPASFLPALWWWHGWVVRRYGIRPRAWRLVAEVAFALQVIVTLILLGIA